MKIPEKAPDWTQIRFTPDLAIKTKGLVKKANGSYMYWDDFKYQPMPDGITPEDAWAMVKLSRIAQKRNIPLTDSKGNPFGYWQPDAILRELHYIDQQSGGSILVEDSSVLAEEKRRYMISSLVDEAISSSQIEGAVTTRVVAKEMLQTGRKPKDHAEQMIYNNYISMQEIKKHTSQPLSVELITKIHAAMTQNTLDDPTWEGRFRRPEDGEIHVFDADGQKDLHAPPPASGVSDSMQKLCEYVNTENKDEFVNPVIKAILIHFWIAYVHPFMDGNGRTARALFYWYMLKNKYWFFEYLSVSTAILSARSQYYRAFLYSEIDDNDATYFIMYNLMAIHRAIEELNAYIKKKQQEKKSAYHFAVKYPALNFRQRTLLASALEKPQEVFTIETHSNVHGVTYQTARTDLLGLKEMGLLEMRKEGKKFIFTPVPNLAEKLDA